MTLVIELEPLTYVELTFPPVRFPLNVTVPLLVTVVLFAIAKVGDIVKEVPEEIVFPLLTVIVELPVILPVPFIIAPFPFNVNVLFPIASVLLTKRSEETVSAALIVKLVPDPIVKTSPTDIVAADVEAPEPLKVI